ncbi:MAG: hypothetical protein JJU42_09755 [Rhodobacteraceae bacterium]|nr:hypothetical protein [Rubellimicrobium sp.]MCC5984636.1 hypothetical protein [Paracoccaceae bacterium]
MDETGNIWPQSEEGLQGHLRDCMKLVVTARDRLGVLLDLAQVPEDAALRDMADTHHELEKALRRVLEAEARLYDFTSRQAGRDRPGHIDFDAIRNEIGCRLSRLRECCRSD